MWRKIETGDIYSAHHEIRAAHRQISMPAVLTDEVIASLGIEPLPPEERPAPTYDEQVRAIEAQFERAIAAIKKGYTADEISSWPYQEAQARAWIADNNAQTPLLDWMLTTRGGTKEALVARIVAKADAFWELYGIELGKKQAAIGALTAPS